MKRKWDLSKAVNCLNDAGLEIDVTRNVVVGKGTNGLQACSAADYLQNHQKYTIVLIKNLVSNGG